MTNKAQIVTSFRIPPDLKERIAKAVEQKKYKYGSDLVRDAIEKALIEIENPQPSIQEIIKSEVEKQLISRDLEIADRERQEAEDAYNKWLDDEIANKEAQEALMIEDESNPDDEMIKARAIIEAKAKQAQEQQPAIVTFMKDELKARKAIVA